MLTVIERKNPNALALVEAEADRIIAAMAEAGALRLYDNLDASTSDRTGTHYAGQPRPSSTPTQMPQEQDGNLQRMVDHGRVGPLQHAFGLYPQTAEQRAQAEAMEQGAPRINVIARAPVLRTALDSRTHADMRGAAQKAAR